MRRFPIVAASWLLGVQAAAVQPDAQPDAHPRAPDARATDAESDGAAPPTTQAELNRRARASEFDAMCEAYRRLHDGELDADVERAFADWADFVALRTAWPDAIRNDDGTLRRHDDPMVRASALTYLVLANSPEDLAEELNSTLDELIADRYPPVRVCLFARTLHTYFKRIGDGVQENWAWNVYIEQYILACATPEMTTAMRRYLYAKAGRELAGDKGLDFGEWFVDRLDQTEGVDPWILAQCRAVFLWDVAYAARGSRFSSETTDEQWAEFERLSGPAVASFVEAIRIDPACPEAATELITAARSGKAPGDTDVYHWFDRAVGAQIDYEPAYNTMRSAITPRWVGSYDEMVAFAERCVRPELAGTRIPFQPIFMIDTFYDEIRYWPEDDYVWTRRDFLLAVERASDMLLELDDTPSMRSYLGTIGAYAAYKRGDLPTAERRLRACGGEINRNAAEIIRARDQSIPGLVLPLAAEDLGVRARTASMYERAGDWRRAAGLWREILTDVPPEDTLLLDATTDRLRTASWKAEFEAGDWVELSFDEDLTGWRTIDGEWERVDDGAVRMLGRGDYSQLALGVDLGRRYELEALVAPPASPTPSFRFGLVHASNIRRSDAQRVYRSFSVHPGDGAARCSWFWSVRDHAAPTDTPLDAPIVMRVTQDEDRVRCHLADELVLDVDLVNPSSYGESPDSRVGLGGFGVNGGLPVEFSKVRVRKLPPRDE